MNDEANKLQNMKFEKAFLKGFAVSSTLLGLLVMIIFYFRLAQHFSISSATQIPNMSTTGQIGDFVGGVVGTIFSLVGVLLLFITLRDQRESFKKERFEQRFFELIKLHSENLSQFEIAGVIRGRACFKFIINELRFIYQIVEVGALQMFAKGEIKIETQRQYLETAYLIMFFGIGYSSERQLNEIFSKDQAKLFQNFVKPYLEEVQGEYQRSSKNYEAIYFTFRLPMTGIPDSLTLETRFYPFDGHTSRLGHYFRLLFQIVNYIDKQPVEVVNQLEKYGYAKNLRATLSNQEQLLLFYNAISTLGADWIDDSNNLITKYALIKNIPLGVIDIGIHPHEIFGKMTSNGDFLFETDEILAKRTSN
jgi:hypothetical protein